MQLSLPVLPFDPAIAQPGANPALTGRPGNATPQGTPNFGDFLPDNPGSAPRVGTADTKRAVSTVLAKSPVSNPGAAGSSDLETVADDGDAPEKDAAANANWLFADGYAQRFTAPTPPTKTGTETAGAATEPEVVGTEAAAQENFAGGKAVGLTRPMPGQAQGDGRARAMLHRAERNSVLASPDVGGPSPAAPATTAQPAPMPEGEAEPEAADSEGDDAAPSATSSNESLDTPVDAGFLASSYVINLPATSESSPVEEVTGGEIPTSATVDGLAETPTRDTAANAFADSGVQVGTPSSGDPVTDGAVPVEMGDSAPPTPVATPESSAPSLPLADPAGEATATEATAQPTEPAPPPSETNPDGVVSDVPVQTRSPRRQGVPFGKDFPQLDSDKARAAPGLAIAAEKFAGGFERRRGISTTGDSAVELKSLRTDKQDVASESVRFGINVAKPESSMAASATSTDTSAPQAAALSTPAVSATSALAHGAKDGSQGGANVSAAHRAVESAIAMADHFTGGEQRGVTLQFSVSGVDLAVRVEMRADGVHTTFRTDSPELRAALAHEWQVVSAQSSDRPVRLADPVFAGSSSGSFNGTDTGSQQHRDSAARGGQFSSENFSSFRSPSRAPQHAATVPVIATQDSLPSSGLLRTFA